MKVLGEHILVKVSSGETMSKGGILIPEQSNERKYEGEVVDVGSHEDIEKIGVKVGDKVIYPKGMNIEVTEDGVTYDIVSIYDILAKVN